MMNHKWMGLLALGGVLMAAQGCTGDVSDDTPTPTEAEATPEELNLDPSSDVVVSCASNTWSFTLIVDGWTETDPEPLLGIYEDKDLPYCVATPSSCYREDGHPIAATDSFVDPYYEVLELQLDVVGDLGSQVDGSSTIFTCDKVDANTYSFCSYDYNFPSRGEVCYFWGGDPDYWSANARM